MEAKLDKQFAEVTPSELPLVSAGHGCLVLLEVQQPFLDVGERAQVI